ncbi:MAG: preprotein translocase subunit SecY [Candidatus Midichloria sp.]|nr:preprotein translocase subunit SecY [Candidatus Midichloria sp.]
MSLVMTKRSLEVFAKKPSSGELTAKIFFIIFALFLYRLGTYIPLPGVNTLAMSQIASQQSGSILGMFNMFTGGALGRMSIFALNIMPYITASIIMQLMTVISSDISVLKKDGEAGRKKINQYTKYLTVVLALSQGYGIAVGIESMNSATLEIVLNPGLNFRIIAALSLLGGTMFVVWLGDQITARNLGNGSSLIIFTGIVAGLPSALASLFEMGRTGAISTFFILAVIVMALGLIFGIIFIERAQRKITVRYPKRQVGNKVYAGDSTHLPLKLNTSGVIPPIFASSILLFPMTIVNFMSASEPGAWKQFIAMNLAHGKTLYIVLYVVMIFFFGFFYTSVVFNPDETAENLRKNGAIVLGRRPGKHTAEYLDYVLTRLTVIGSIYLSIVCIIPEILMTSYSVPFYLGGTSLLIVVNVVMDLFTRIQTYFLTSQYHHLLKKNKIGIH